MVRYNESITLLNETPKYLFYLFSISYYKARQRAKWTSIQLSTMLEDHKHIAKRTIMKNQNRSATLERPAMQLLRGFNWSAVDTLSPLVLLWFLRHLVVWFAWKIPSSQVHYLRNIEIKFKSKIKQTRGLKRIATMKIRSKRNPPVKQR